MVPADVERRPRGHRLVTGDLGGTVAGVVDPTLFGRQPWGAERVELGLLPRPPWQADGLCREHPEITSFPLLDQSPVTAMAVCGRCLVAGECRAWALAQPVDPAGVWGGTTEEDRAELRGPDVPCAPDPHHCAACERWVACTAVDPMRHGVCDRCRQRARRARARLVVATTARAVA